MISLITCSIKPEVCSRMLESVSKTIGTAYETIVFDNREKKYGLCKVYNEAAEKANGDYLCFVHEDIVIKTNGWGDKLIEFVTKTNDCGIIGMAGGHYAPRNFMTWHVNNTSPINIYDPTLSNNQEPVYSHCNPKNELFTKVVCIDGVFLFVTKAIWRENPFDESTFKGFHFYDADFSLTIAQKHQNYVYFGIDIYHFSSGKMEKTFCDYMYLFQKKWKRKLPYCLPGYKISFREEAGKAKKVFSLYRENGFSKMESYWRVFKINDIFLFLYFFAKNCLTL